MYASAKDCRFLKKTFPLTVNLPEGVSVQAGQRYLTATYKHRDYSLAVSRAGILFGFSGAIQPNKEANLVFVSFGPFDTRAFLRRHTSPEALEALLLEEQEKQSDRTPELAQNARNSGSNEFCPHPYPSFAPNGLGMPFPLDSVHFPQKSLKSGVI